mgnify:CR=1 FL=1
MAAVWLFGIFLVVIVEEGPVVLALRAVDERFAGAMFHDDACDKADDKTRTDHNAHAGICLEKKVVQADPIHAVPNGSFASARGRVLQSQSILHRFHSGRAKNEEQPTISNKPQEFEVSGFAEVAPAGVLGIAEC